ncbi:hypothetical protein ACQJBY_000535 [Aegilops geniculata]
MALSRRMTASALLLLFLLVATDMGATTVKVAEARDCLSQSHQFKGACLSSSNCAAVCRTSPRTSPRASATRRTTSASASARGPARPPARPALLASAETRPMIARSSVPLANELFFFCGELMSLYLFCWSVRPGSSVSRTSS